MHWSGLNVVCDFTQVLWAIAEGLAVGEKELEQFKSDIGYDPGIRFSGAIGGTYDHFAVDYGWLACLYGICIAAILLTRWGVHPHVINISNVFAGLSFLLILYTLRILIRDKAMVESFFWEGPRNAFAQLTITYDWLLVVLTVFLISLQLTVIILRWKLRGPHSWLKFVG